jgi:Ca-activated chloride channel family protein
MTDGEDHEGDPVAAAKELAQNHIRVYTVAIGSEQPAPIPLRDSNGNWAGNLKDESGNEVYTSLTPQNEDTLKKIAELTGGRYIRSGAGQVGVSQLESEFANLKQSDAKTRKIIVHENRYRWFLFPAWLCLLIFLLLPDRWRIAEAA